MKIDMNKNFEQEFRVDVWKGLNGRELITGIIGFLASMAVAVPLWYFTKVPMNICVYAGLPVLLLIGFLGVYQYQGSTIFQLLKELRYLSDTKELAAEAEEYKGCRKLFSMESSTIQEKSSRKEKRN